MLDWEWEDEWEEFEEEEETCPYGYTWDECCECVLRLGIETCEFQCPFISKDSPVIRVCYKEGECDKILEMEAEAE